RILYENEPYGSRPIYHSKYGITKKAFQIGRLFIYE
ncbi:MAG: hypothetical protein ACI828_002049, partial [Flavobacteriales bacterium]